jgi:hypothetical protein
LQRYNFSLLKVTLLKAKLDFKKLPHISLIIILLICFVWILEPEAITIQHSINCAVFVTERESVYHAVRAETFFQVNLRF